MVFVTAQTEEFLSGGHFPHFDCAIFTGAEKAPAIGGKVHGTNPIAVTPKDAQRFTRLGVPEPGDLIPIGRDHCN